MRYIDAEKLKDEIERLDDKYRTVRVNGTIQEAKEADLVVHVLRELSNFVSSIQREQPEENKLPSKRTRVNFAICRLQSFKPLREAIVLDGYVHDEDKSYRENLLNYIHAIPENRLKEIRDYLKEKGWWTFDDDADWMDQPESVFEKEIKVYQKHYISVKESGYSLDWLDIETTARHFYELGRNSVTEKSAGE